MAIKVSDNSGSIKAEVLVVNVKDVLEADEKIAEAFNNWVKLNDDRLVTSVFPSKCIQVSNVRHEN